MEKHELIEMMLDCDRWVEFCKRNKINPFARADSEQEILRRRRDIARDYFDSLPEAKVDGQIILDAGGVKILYTYEKHDDGEFYETYREA